MPARCASRTRSWRRRSTPTSRPPSARRCTGAPPRSCTTSRSRPSAWPRTCCPARAVARHGSSTCCARWRNSRSPPARPSRPRATCAGHCRSRPAPSSARRCCVSSAPSEAATGLPGAIEHLEEALAADGSVTGEPARARTLLALGRALAAAGRHTDALERFDEAAAARRTGRRCGGRRPGTGRGGRAGHARSARRAALRDGPRHPRRRTCNRSRERDGPAPAARDALPAPGAARRAARRDPHARPCRGRRRGRDRRTRAPEPRCPWRRASRCRRVTSCCGASAR